MASNTESSAQSVLEAPPPRFEPEQVSAIASELFGVAGRAINLGSERDQTFLIDDGGPGAVLKISNSGEDPAALDFELEAILHIARVRCSFMFWTPMNRRRKWTLGSSSASGARRAPARRPPTARSGRRR